MTNSWSLALDNVPLEVKFLLEEINQKEKQAQGAAFRPNPVRRSLMPLSRVAKDCQQ